LPVKLIGDENGWLSSFFSPWSPEARSQKGVENYIKKVYINRAGGMMRTNVTVKAEDTLIERAKEFDDFMDRVKYANPGRTFSREEMNAR
jgi:hypothetical protein